MSVTRVEENVVATRVVCTTCDLCGATHHNGNRFDWNDGWSGDADFIHVRRQTRSDPFETEEIFDVCPDCWLRHILRFMKYKKASPERIGFDGGPVA